MQYNTGYTSQPIDFSRASQAMMNSAIQMKIAEVKKESAELQENEKFLLKALDVNTLEDVSSELSGVFGTKINGLHDKARDLFKLREGKLTYADKMEIQRNAVALQNEITQGKMGMEAYKKVQEIMLNPTYEGHVDKKNMGIVAGRLVEDLKKGDMSAGSKLSALPMQFYTPPTEESLVQKGMNGLKFGTNKVIIGENGTKYTTSQTTNQKDVDEGLLKTYLSIPSIRDQIITTDENGNEDYNQPVIDKLNQKYRSSYITESTDQKLKPRSGSGSSSNAISIAPQPVQMGNGVYTDALNVASSSAYQRSIEGAKDEFGNIVNDKRPRNFRLQGVSRDKDGNLVANISVMGSPVTKKGEQLYEMDGEKDGSQTIEELKNTYVAQAQAKLEKDFELNPDPKIEKQQDGSIDIIFKSVKPENKRYGWQKKIGYTDVPEQSKDITFHFLPVIDKQSETFMTLPMNGFNKELISESDRKKIVEGTGMRLGDYLDREMKKQPVKKETVQLSKNANVLP